MRVKLDARSLFLFLLFFGIFLFALQPITDPDFWWHLKTGQLILTTSQIPHFDQYSFPAYGKPWIAHEWLSESIIWLLYRLGGYPLSICTFALLITAAFYFTYLRCPDGSRPYIAGFAILLGALMTISTWGVRPQVFSFFLASLFLFLLDRYMKSGRLRYLVPLPLLVLLWVNLHGSYILGLGFIAIYLTADLIDAATAALKEKKRLSIPKRSLYLLAAFFLSTLAALVNPNGISILLYPFQTINDTSISGFILEWASPNFHASGALPLLAMILLLLGLALKSVKRISTVNLLLCLVFSFAVLHAVKQVTYFALVTVPMLAELVSSLIPARSQPVPTGKLFRWVTMVVLIGCVFAAWQGISQLNDKQQQAEELYFPKDAVDWVAENKPEGNVFNAYPYGGYMIWRLYPEYKVYIDGRCDMYGSDFLAKYVKIRQIDEGWQQALDDRDIGWVFVERASYLANALRLAPGWQLAYEDEKSAIFLRE